MRKIVFAAAIAGSALTLAACADNAEEAADTAAEDTVADADADAEAEATAGVLDANTATADELVAVASVSPELADAIVGGQPYADVTGLHAVLMDSLTEEEAAAVLVNVFVPINLNSATREQIMLVPGMDDHMAHEFEEYVPYEDLAEFDREIGKYVDEAEVARFRQYVTL